MITGYGFHSPVFATYTNEHPYDTSIRVPQTSLRMLIPKDIVEHTQHDAFNYASIGDNYVVPFNETDEAFGVGFGFTQQLELPQTWVTYNGEGDAIVYDRSETGALYSQRRLYIDTWATVGNYDMTLENTRPTGVHLVTHNINYRAGIRIIGHMYLHGDSDAQANDTIYYTPTPDPVGDNYLFGE